MNQWFDKEQGVKKALHIWYDGATLQMWRTCLEKDGILVLVDDDVVVWKKWLLFGEDRMVRQNAYADRCMASLLLLLRHLTPNMSANYMDAGSKAEVERTKVSP